MSPDGKTPLPSKRYYDIFTLILTQTVFAYTVAPFIFLYFSTTMIVWSRVYFYTLLGVAASFAAFSRSLPIRKELVKRVNAHQAPATSSTSTTTGVDVASIEAAAREEAKLEGLKRRESSESVAASSMSGVSSGRRAPTLGIADDPEADIDEIVAEVKREIEERKRRGSLVQGFDVRSAVQAKFREFGQSAKGKGQ
jgi:lysophospholipid acyltransferase